MISNYVTPCVGVWIETIKSLPLLLEKFVTPCVGVWIETIPVPKNHSEGPMSHPAWVCGLKLRTGSMDTMTDRRHTLRGWWIETTALSPLK